MERDRLWSEWETIWKMWKRMIHSQKSHLDTLAQNAIHWATERDWCGIPHLRKRFNRRALMFLRGELLWRFSHLRIVISQAPANPQVKVQVQVPPWKTKKISRADYQGSMFTFMQYSYRVLYLLCTFILRIWDSLYTKKSQYQSSSRRILGNC